MPLIIKYINLHIQKMYFPLIRIDKNKVSQVCENLKKLCQNKQIMFTIGVLSVDTINRYINRHLVDTSAKYQPCISQVSTNIQAIYELTWPTYQPTVGQVSVEYWLSVGQVSVRYRLIHVHRLICVSRVSVD